MKLALEAERHINGIIFIIQVSYKANKSRKKCLATSGLIFLE
jgi:hypothetical protein